MKLLIISLIALAGITERTNVTSTGTSGTPVRLSPGAVYTAECSAKAYYRFGSSSVTVSKTRTDAEYGEPLFAGEKKSGIVVPKSLSQAYVVIISDSGTVTCTFWRDTDAVARSGGGGSGGTSNIVVGTARQNIDSGTATVGGDGTVTVTFTVTFSATPIVVASSNNGVVTIDSRTTTQAVLGGTIGASVYWIALGNT